MHEELKAMYHYFGDELLLFKEMVVIITSSEFQIMKKMIKYVQRVFMQVHQLSTKSSLSKCPPIVYALINDEGKRICETLRQAYVLDPSEFVLNTLDSIM